MSASAAAKAVLCSPLVLIKYIFKKAGFATAMGKKGEDGSGSVSRTSRSRRFPAPRWWVQTPAPAEAHPAAGDGDGSASEVWVLGSRSLCPKQAGMPAAARPVLRFYPCFCRLVTSAKCFSAPPSTSAVILIVLPSLVPAARLRDDADLLVTTAV